MVPDSEPLFLLWDFNASVGGDHESWPDCIGHFGVGRMNENGQRLLELLPQALHQQHVFQHKATSSSLLDAFKVPSLAPPGLNHHQASPATERTHHTQLPQRGLRHGSQLGEVRLRPKKFHHSKRSGLPRINIATTVVPELCAQFAESVVSALEGQPAAETTEERWRLLRDTIHSTALSIFGKKERRNPDWYDESLPVMEPAISAKRVCLKNYKREPSNNNLAALRTARNEAQRTARYCANQYWLNLCHSIQEAANKGNTRGVYEESLKA